MMLKMNDQSIGRRWYPGLAGVLLLSAGWTASAQVPPALPGEPPTTAGRQTPHQVPIPLRPADPEPPPAQQAKSRRQPYPKDTTLTWDATFKEFYSKPKAKKGELFFHVANHSKNPVTITQIRPGCGCTLTKHPKLPWTLQPGDGDRINLSIDLKGKHGTLTKSVSVFSSAGRKDLLFKVHIPSRAATSGMAMSERLKNMQIAAKDRQAIFKSNCKKCHYDPALNQQGEDLFVAACGICHETPHQATMVPNLSIAQKGVRRNEAYWTLWITHGKPGTLMPAFHQGQGGPLTSEQIKDLAAYLTKRFPDNLLSGKESKTISP